MGSGALLRNTSVAVGLSGTWTGDLQVPKPSPYWFVTTATQDRNPQLSRDATSMKWLTYMKPFFCLVFLTTSSQPLLCWNNTFGIAHIWHAAQFSLTLPASFLCIAALWSIILNLCSCTQINGSIENFRGKNLKDIYGRGLVYSPVCLRASLLGLLLWWELHLDQQHNSLYIQRTLKTALK